MATFPSSHKRTIGQPEKHTEKNKKGRKQQRNNRPMTTKSHHSQRAPVGITMLFAALSLVGTFCSSDAATASPETRSCFDNAAALQDAIDALPQGKQLHPGGIPELLLCPFVEIPVTKPIRVHHRTVRIGCAEAVTHDTEDKQNAKDTMCHLKGGGSEEDARILEVVGTDNPFEAYTLQLENLHFDGGTSYLDAVAPAGQESAIAIGGAAVMSRGANVIVEDCFFENNVASQEGGALYVQDQGRPILFIITNTIFRDNLSIEDDCSSVYFQQEHPMTMAELNNERDFVTTSGTSSISGNGSRSQRRLQNAIDQWDDPAKAALLLEGNTPGARAELCF